MGKGTFMYTTCVHQNLNSPRYEYTNRGTCVLQQWQQPSQLMHMYIQQISMCWCILSTSEHLFHELVRACFQHPGLLHDFFPFCIQFKERIQQFTCKRKCLAHKPVPTHDWDVILDEECDGVTRVTKRVDGFDEVTAWRVDAVDAEQAVAHFDGAFSANTRSTIMLLCAHLGHIIQSGFKMSKTGCRLISDVTVVHPYTDQRSNPQPTQLEHKN